MSLASYIFVRNCTKSDNKRDAGLTTPEDVERFDNIVYGDDKKWQIMDIYRPKDMTEKLPVIVSAHGGGWVYGTKETYQFYCMSLARRGFVVVNYSYRLAPKHKYPSAMEDTNTVFNWVMTNGEKYGMDLNNIFAVGDSAGAQIIGLYACMITNSEYGARYDFKYPEGLVFRALGLNCGIYSTSNDDVKGLFKELLPNKGKGGEIKLLSVVDYIGDGFPPCYILTANEDFLKDEPKELKKVLDRHNIRYEYKLYGDESSPLYHVFHCDTRSNAAGEANDDECNYFKRFIVRES